MKISKIMILLLFLLIPFSMMACKSKTNNVNQSLSGSVVAENGRYLFYNSFDRTGDTLMRSDLDGNNEIELIKDNDFWVKNIIVSGEWIYYVNNGIHKIRIDGSGHQMIRAGRVSNLNVDGEWLYYQIEEYYDVSSCVMDSKYSIWKIKMDGTEEQLVIEDGGKCLTAINGYLYYLSYEPDNRSHGYNTLCKIKSDGKEEKQILDDDNLETMFIYDNIIYCGRKRSRPNRENVFTIDFNGKNKKELEFSATDMFICNDGIYFSFYYNDDKKLLRYDLSSEKIIEIINITADKIGAYRIHEPAVREFSVINGQIYFVINFSIYDEEMDCPVSNIGMVRCDIDGNNLTLLSHRR